jgi:hypothetical protein
MGWLCHISREVNTGVRLHLSAIPRIVPADFQTRQRVVQALVNSVTLYPNRAVVSGVLPLDGDIPNDARLLRSPLPETVNAIITVNFEVPTL